MPRPSTLSAQVWISITFAVVVLSCGLKNYLSYLVSGTALCPYLCPSWLGWDALEELPLLGDLFAAQARVQAEVQSLFNKVWADNWNLATRLLIAPLLEEAIYRGPFYFSRRWSHTSLWWIIGFLSSLVFALSHGRSGLALLPLIVLGMSSLWLISATRRFWPSVVLHMLQNFFFTSVILYQSLWVSD